MPHNFESSPKLLAEKYRSKADSEGFIFIGDFATQELKRQAKSVAGLADGDGGDCENLGEGLKIKGDSGNYSNMKIHIDDLDIFVSKVKEHFGN